VGQGSSAARGFRNADHDARDEGWHVNHNKIQRLWREEGLPVPHKRRRKRLGTSTTPNPPKADAPNRVWAVDFQFDATTDARPVKIVSIVDEHTRECLARPGRALHTGQDLLNELDRIAAGRSYPAVLGCDNGPELACQAMADWAGGGVGLWFIPPGEPLRNGQGRVVQQPDPRRMPEHQHLLVTGPGPRRDQRLEGGPQPPPAAQLAWLSSPCRLRSHLRPAVIDAHRRGALLGPTG
jgi:transposase InsO family protein